ncbi:type II CAAX endopeptidase family protein [Streptomyces marokkonensis]|uniref:Type II CAAX endopeptidase family protein n=1 Tax=Streptomyces marokkonensis TaxID=324855 RepID=A0ABP7P2T3_9ACTN
MRFVWQFLAVMVMFAATGSATSAVKDNDWLSLVVGLASAALAILVYAWVVRRTEHRAAMDVAREGAVVKTGWGMLIGIGMFGAVIANLYAAGHYEIDGLGSPEGAVGLVGFMAGAAVAEEVVFRGVLFRIIEEHIGTYIALVLTGVVFGLMHLANENATLWGAIAIAIEAGFMLAAAYAATRTLWVPIGVHFGWNFAAAGIFSTEVSGNGASQGLLDTATSGPELFTGGGFGPEGSIHAIGFGVVLTIVFLWLAHRRGNIKPRPRRVARVDSTATLPR